MHARRNHLDSSLNSPATAGQQSNPRSYPHEDYRCLDSAGAVAHHWSRRRSRIGCADIHSADHHPSREALPISDYYNQNVYDNRDNKIGEVNDLLVDNAGKVNAVILGVGGFLGVGEKNVAVAFPSLKVAEA